MDSLTFIGTATTMLRLGSFTLLTDPNFLHRGQRAYLGKGLWSRRLTEPAMQPADLPAARRGASSRTCTATTSTGSPGAELARSQPVITTPAAARRLGRWGFDDPGPRHLGEHGDAPPAATRPSPSSRCRASTPVG